MNQANQLQGESKHSKLLFEAKNNLKISKIDSTDSSP